MKKVRTKKMEKAFKLGIEAFEHGKKCVPAHDTTFMNLMFGCDRRGGDDLLDGEFAAAAKAWLEGWTLSNLGSEV